jgi:LytR cell envelope-related transcriptional attenuator
MKDAIQQIGAIAGLASFLGLGVLAFLYFAQARHVRDLEDKATFVPDEADMPAAVPAAAATSAAAAGTAAAAAPATRKERKAAAAASTPAAAAEAQLEAARQTEVARAAAERRQRFQQRRGSDPFTSDADVKSGGSSGRRMPEPRAMIVIGLGVAVLLAGVVFGASRILGGSSDSGTATNSAASEQGTGPPVEVAVLNGTPVPGLAAKIGEMVRQAGSYKLGNVTNTETPFDVTTVMFDPKDPKSKATAQTLAAQLKVTQVQPMTGEVKKASTPSTVAVVVGEDRAGT